MAAPTLGLATATGIFIATSASTGNQEMKMMTLEGAAALGVIAAAILLVLAGRYA